MLQVNRLHQQSLQQISSRSVVAQAASAVVITVGLLVLLGWWFDIRFLKTFFFDTVAMKANAALCFILSGISLWLSLKGEEAVEDKRIIIPDSLLISRVCAFTILIIAVLTLTQYLPGWDFSIYARLDPTFSGTIIPFVMEPMGLSTAVDFLVIGSALKLVSQPRHRHSYWYAQVLTLIVALISLQSIVGYAYGVDLLQSNHPNSIGMTLYSTLTFTVLCVGILSAHPASGFMQVIMSDTYGGLLARRLLLASIALPLVLGWFILQGLKAGFYKPELALSLLVIVLIVSFCVLIWESVVALERLAKQRDAEAAAKGDRVKEALKVNEEKLKSFVDANVIGILFGDIHGNIRQANDEFLRMIDYTKEDLQASKIRWVDITPPEYLPLDAERIAEAMEKGACTSYEKEYIRKDGSRVPVLIGYTLIGEAREESVAYILDLSDRKQAEQAIRNQQKWLEDLLNLMPTPMLLIEPGTARVTFANVAADLVAGGKFPKAQSLADYKKYYHATDAAGNPIPVEQAPGVRVARGDRLVGFELDWHTPVGIRSLLMFADTLSAMHGNPATCVLVFQDITNLKQVEKALSLGYKRLQLLFTTASDLLSSQQPIALIDSVFKKLSEQIDLDVYVNYLVFEDKQVLQLASYTGISESQAKTIEQLEFGQGVCGTIIQERRPIALENVQQLTNPETEILRSVGLSAYYGYPLIAQGRLLGSLCFGSRTRLKFTQNEIGMMQAVCDQIAIAMERASLIASLQQQTEQLREANRMKDEFLTILSHELRSPLNAILGWAQLLRSRRKLDETRVEKALETIERNARAQTQLVEDLLDISRMIRGKVRLDVRTCDLVPIIYAALATVRLAAEVKQIDLKFSITPSPTQFLVAGDGERLQQVIWNLLSNSIKFTPTGGGVEIRLSVSSPDSALIQVSDTGIGMSADFLPYVFDRFRQADSSTTRLYGGLGLGLAIVRHLVELHGGTVYAESLGQGQGATFTVKLPLLKRG